MSMQRSAIFGNTRGVNGAFPCSFLTDCTIQTTLIMVDGDARPVWVWLLMTFLTHLSISDQALELVQKAQCYYICCLCIKTYLGNSFNNLM